MKNNKYLVKDSASINCLMDLEHRNTIRPGVIMEERPTKPGDTMYGEPGWTVIVNPKSGHKDETTSACKAYNYELLTPAVEMRLQLERRAAILVGV